MKKIVLTGGGTAGHVTPNIALLPKLKENGFEISYIGSYTGMEKQLIEDVINGNREHASALLNEILGRIYFASGNNIVIRYKGYRER